MIFLRILKFARRTVLQRSYLALAWLGSVIGLCMSMVLMTSPAHADEQCFSLPNGTKFCRPQAVDELTQCIRIMQQFPNRPAAEACRQQLVRSCRTIADDQFERQYKVQRPRLIDAKAHERTPEWNRYCPSSLGYRYTPVRQPATRGPGKAPVESNPDQNRVDALREAGGHKFLIEPFDVSTIAPMPTAGPCLCRDGTKPVFGFCTGAGGAYKPECARE